MRDENSIDTIANHQYQICSNDTSNSIDILTDFRDQLSTGRHH